MMIGGYLCVSKGNNFRGRVRLSHRAPALAANEIAIRFDLDLPDELFTKPTLRASIKVQKEAVSRPMIDAAVLDNIQQVLEQQLGAKIELAVIEPKKNGCDK